MIRHAELLAQMGWVQALARRLVSDPSVADDVAQETWLKALQRPPRQVAGPGLRAWLAAVTRTLARQFAREKRRRTARERIAARPEPAASTLDVVQRGALQQQVVEAVMQLEEPYRATILLRYLDGLSAPEIASRQGITPAAVRQRLARGLHQVRARLDREHGGNARPMLLALVPLAKKAPGASAAALQGVVVSSKTKVGLSCVVVIACLILGWQVLWSGGGPARERADAARSTAPVPVGERAARTTDDSVRTVTPTDEAPVDRPPAAVSPALSGRVLRADATPAAGVKVRFEPTRGGNNPVAVADAAGAFVLEGVRGPGAVIAAEPGLVTVFAGRVDQVRTHARPVVVVAPRHPLGGLVVDEQGAPLEGVVVAVQPPAGFRVRFSDVMDFSLTIATQAKTDAEGRFALPDAPKIEGARLTARLEGYRPYDEPEPREANDRLVLTLVRPPAELSGIVVDARDQPVPDARVSLGVVLTRSDEQGRFAFDLRDGSSLNRQAVRFLGKVERLMAVKQGYLPARRVIETAADTGLPLPAADLTLRLESESRTIAGQVVSPAGKPVAGVRVWVTDVNMLGFRVVLENVMAGADDGAWNFATTDDRGRFEIAGLADQAYRVAAMDPETLLRATSDPVRAGTDALVLRFDKSKMWKRIRGRIVSKDGHGIAGVEVRAMCDAFRMRYEGRVMGTRHSAAPTTVTDEHGAFSLENVPHFDVYLRIDGENIVPIEHGRMVEGGLLSLTGGKSEGIEVVVPLRIHVKVELRAAAEADLVGVLDAAGKALPINIFTGRGRRTDERAPLVEGRSEVLTVTDHAVTLVLYRGDREMRRTPLALSPGKVNVVRP